jgi:hypothetical protein
MEKYMNAIDATESIPMNGTLAQFNKYGLPGLVIGFQFLIIIGLIYVVVTALQGNTKAMTEITEALGRLTETIKERR